MSEPYTGGCACGAIRYKVSAEPIVMLDCQCRQCQRESGTGHASHLTFECEPVVEGKATHWDAVGDGGVVKRRAFCPTCGAPVYMTFPDIPGYFVVRAASLDDPTRYKPQLICWTASGQPWDQVDPHLPKFEKMPPR
ncbi:aldehyde-activating protein [Rhizobium sp. AC44/96]|uniref:GFA family protein n=1 Tax=unclassified Rhizobium TaxID=2613769 RepID=UPI00080FE773|nr:MULTISPECIES: GFA family protein [unclassified Rhizobium]MDM9619224.1 GFA family protein [Rhizobium sp. S96]OCJ17527.1 aldehyde-activating protein [Rhizobium sp. AC44/96]